MRRTKKMLALLLAGVLTFSNVAYAAPGDGGSAPTENEAETDISNPEEEKEAANTPEEPTEAETLSEENAVPIDGETEELPTEESEEDPNAEIDAETDEEDADGTDAETDEEDADGTDAETDEEDADGTDAETDEEDADGTDAETDEEDADGEDAETDEEDADGEDAETDKEDADKTDADSNEDAAGAAEEEVTEGEEESEEAVTYKITFAEEPESHGTLLTIDDEEIGEEGIETDEEGYAQFKVQADEGWTAEAVCGDEVLSLVEDSYYEVQVSEDTEVTVSYQEVVVEEEPLPEVVEEPEAAAEDETPKLKVAANLLSLDPLAVEEVTISVVDENEEPIPGADTTVEIGVCGNVAPEIEGYDFVKATVDGDEIYSIGSFGDTVYYVPMEDQNTGLLLGDKEIVFHYELHVETYDITYSAGAGMKYNGPVSVKQGESYSFTVTPSKAEDTGLTVYVNGTDISNSGVLSDAATGMMRYTVNDVQGVQDVTISEYPISTYTFTYNNDSIRQGDIINPSSGAAISAGGSIQFTLRSETWTGVTNVDGHQWHLNLLAINGEYVNVPTTFNEGDWAETTLSTGEIVRIELTNRECQKSCVFGSPCFPR